MNTPLRTEDLLDCAHHEQAKISPILNQCPHCGGSTPRLFLVAPDRFNGQNVMYRLLRCHDCLLVWIDNRPPCRELPSHYGRDYDLTVSRAGESMDRFIWRREQLTRHKTPGTVLDIGCSSGSFLSCMKDAGWKVFGVEMSPASARAAEQSCGASIFVGDVLNARFEVGSFDAITAFHVLEHMYDPVEVMRRAFRWLKPGGIFYLMVPNIDSAAARIFKKYWFALELPRHLFHFCPVSLRNIAYSAGLEEVFLKTNREPFIESSLRYIADDVFHKLGLQRTPLARARNAGVFHRILRKAMRLSVYPVVSRSMSVIGPGESIHAMFQKPINSLTLTDNR